MLVSGLPETSCHQRHLPSEPPGLSWAVALVQDRSLGHPLGDAPNVAGDVRLPGLGLTALQLKGLGVTPPEHPLQHDFCHHMHRDSWVGFVFVLQLVPSQQGGAGGRGRSQAVTPLILKVVSRDFLRRFVLWHMITPFAGIPDLHPPERVWHRLKHRQRTKAKLLIKTELILAADCRHLNALPAVCCGNRGTSCAHWAQSCRKPSRRLLVLFVGLCPMLFLHGCLVGRSGVYLWHGGVVLPSGGCWPRAMVCCSFCLRFRAFYSAGNQW